MKYSSQTTAIIAKADSFIQEKGIANFIKYEMGNLFGNYLALKNLCKEMDCITVEELEEELKTCEEDIPGAMQVFRKAESSWNEFLVSLDSKLVPEESEECNVLENLKLRHVDQPEQVLDMSQILISDDGNSRPYTWAVFLRHFA